MKVTAIFEAHIGMATARKNLLVQNAMDIIFCHNVIMYFSQTLQKQLITQFHHALPSD
jgi:chemotaxis methyl-accepting protein methylase